MDYIVSQFTNPAFAYKLFLFFLYASILVFILGLALVWKSAAALRFMSWMSTWISTRKFMKPAEMPHLVDSVVSKHPALLGLVIALSVAVSTLVLLNIEAEAFRRLLFDAYSDKIGVLLASATKNALLIGNVFAAVAGVLLIFAPRLFANIEARANKWVSMRKATYPIEKMHTPLDGWISANPTVSGIVLIVAALAMGITMYVEMMELARLL